MELKIINRLMIILAVGWVLMMAATIFNISESKKECENKGGEFISGGMFSAHQCKIN